ncbi:MAG TPA: hypothetical protein VFT66_06180 [Roseiflexaceae bacterium]|jgi:hypothetical protein|nr:hypothetical protein [Roseiflexaceae bacterium]
MEVAPQTRAEVPAVVRPRWSAWAQTLLIAVWLFAVCAAVFALIQFGTNNLVDNDAFYHTKMALLIRQQGLAPNFIWLPMTILNPSAFYDHHMLFHVWLSLFVGNGDEARMIFGAKIATVVMASLMVMSLWWLFRTQKVRWSVFWALAIFTLSQAFLFRMSMTRGQSPSLLVLILGLICLFQRRYWLLLPVGFVYVWLYNAFPLLMVAAGAYFVATLLTERRWAWGALIFPAAGIVAGLLINPYFPRDLAFIFEHLLPKLGVGNGNTTPVGNEWYPYDTWTLIQNSGLALLAWILGALALGWRERRMDRATLTAFMLSIIFGYMVFKSRRFIEYFPAFALIFATLSIAPVLEELVDQLRPRWQRFVPGVMAVVLLVPGFLTVTQARQAMADQSMPVGIYADASHWLRDHSKPGSMIFQTDWDDFPMLFFYNSSDIYTAGLDPTFMQLYNPELYDEWVKITRGQVAKPGNIIRSQFGASYVITDLQHTDFIAQAKNDPLLKEVYRDQYAVVFSVAGE